MAFFLPPLAFDVLFKPVGQTSQRKKLHEIRRPLMKREDAWGHSFADKIELSLGEVASSHDSCIPLIMAS